MVDMQLDHLNFEIQFLQNRIERLERLNDEWTFNPKKGNGIENEGILKELEDLHVQMDSLLEKRRNGAS